MRGPEAGKDLLVSLFPHFPDHFLDVHSQGRAVAPHPHLLLGAAEGAQRINDNRKAASFSLGKVGEFLVLFGLQQDLGAVKTLGHGETPR
jgi:hypothetical protein